ncbi:glycerate kinase [Desulfuribacillus alkaliarsenatis]|uniref:Glycerate kinase n=1 Tax=Desulfuribacillus alkaliarsenatis TaxID=766136 RepID=A0A1E5G6B8_9FIRM|nr:glycerate kinase [Desulfuribacillus alkaliarsenatis]OEF98730.1 glycerate kinase [Desulfuribacillus alkaliarsenatis]
MKIVVAPDSFKGSLSAFEFCNIVEEVAIKHFPMLTIVKVPLADGGEGTVDSLIQGGNGQFQYAEVNDPLFRKIEAKYGILEDKKTAVMEIAEASGLHKISKAEQNPMITSTYGTGEMIKHALDQGCRNFIIGIGGSATNDCGIGLIQALGAEVLNKNNKQVAPGGEGLLEAVKIDLDNFDKRIEESTFTIACDVNNPLTGKTGAAYVFSPQKGATPAMVEELDKGLKNYAKVIHNTIGIDIENVPGAGAAGGLGACFSAFFNGQLKSGIEIVLKTTALEEKLKSADIVITGEGKIDTQTAYGKTPSGVAKLARKHHVPVIGICGILEADSEAIKEIELDAAFSIMNRPCIVEEAISDAKTNLESLIYNIFNILTINKK